MAERAVFLDRDNTLIENDGYLGDPKQVKLLGGAAAALAAIRALGYRIVVVSNQSGVARGMFDEAAVEAVNDEMSRQLREFAGAYIDASYYCPYHPEGVVAEYRLDHEWRKPKPGMLKQAAADFALDLTQCWMIGDQDRDIAAGASAGCRTILLQDPSRGSAGTADLEPMGLGVSPDFVVRSLADAARIIAREGRHPPPAVARPGPASGAAPDGVVPHAPSPAAGASKVQSVPSEQTAPTIQAPAAAPIQSEPAQGGAVSHRLEHHLDELVIQLRQHNRLLELRPEFSFSNMAALVLQAFAMIAVVIGLANHFTAAVTFSKLEDYFRAQQSHESAMLWVMTAVVLQGMVISLLIYARHK